MIMAIHQPGRASDSADKIFPYEMKTFQLENGLQVVAIPYHSPGIVAYYTVVRTGSRNEVEPGKSGFAHFFEHIMFRGTEKYPAESYSRELKLLGADNNAFTDDDWTCYHTVLPASGLERIIDMEADRFMNLRYSEQDFKTEAGAILGEYNKNYSGQFLAVFERLQELAFKKHTYGHTTIGYLKDIKAMPNQYSYSLEFHDRWYRPEHCTVIVVGDFSFERLEPLIRQYYGGWKRRNYRQSIPDEEEQKEARRGTIQWLSPTLPLLVRGYKSAPFSVENKDYAALDVVGAYVFGETSELYRELVIEKQLVEFLGVENPARRDPHLFYIYTRVKKEEDVAYVEQAIDRALQKARTEDMDESALRAIQSRLKYSFAMSLDNPDRVAVTIGYFVNLTGDPNSVNALYRRYDELTTADVRDAARRFFDATKSTTVVLRYTR
jgi:zinc protease